MAQQPDSFTIAGQVVSHLDHRGVKGARVSIVTAKDGGRQVLAITGDNGSFSFAGIPAGKYQLRVSDHGAVQLYQQTDGFSTGIIVGPGKDSEHILFVLDSPASISGTVLDEEKDAVPEATVVLFIRRIVLGRYQTHALPETRTAADGTFHFRHLAPGSYYLGVVGQPWYETQQEGKRFTTYPVTYYGGSTSAEGASPLKLVEGAEAQVEIAMHAVPALSVGIDGIPQQSLQQVLTSMIQAGPGGIGLHVSFERHPPSPNRPTETAWELTGVRPGTYLISDPNGEQQSVTLTADTTIHFDENVKTSISGKLVLPGQIPAGLRISLINSAAGKTSYAKVNADGTFAAEHLVPGRYLIAIADASQVYFSKIDSKGASFVNGELDLARGAQVELSITAGVGRTTLDGIAMKDKEPVAGMAVLLISPDLNHGRRVVAYQSDSDGTFTFSRVPFGQYTLIAIDHGRNLLFNEPGALTPYLANGKPVTLPLAKDGPVEVEVQTRR